MLAHFARLSAYGSCSSGPINNKQIKSSWSLSVTPASCSPRIYSETDVTHALECSSFKTWTHVLIWRVAVNHVGWLNLLHAPSVTRLRVRDKGPEIPGDVYVAVSLSVTSSSCCHPQTPSNGSDFLGPAWLSLTDASNPLMFGSNNTQSHSKFQGRQWNLIQCLHKKSDCRFFAPTVKVYSTINQMDIQQMLFCSQPDCEKFTQFSLKQLSMSRVLNLWCDWALSWQTCPSVMNSLLFQWIMNTFIWLWCFQWRQIIMTVKPYFIYSEWRVPPQPPRASPVFKPKDVSNGGTQIFHLSKSIIIIKL